MSGFLKNQHVYQRLALAAALTAGMTTASCSKSHSDDSKIKESDAEVSFKAGNTVPLSAVRDQGVSGFCWSYSTMAYFESLHKLRTQKEIALSPEALAFYHYVDFLKGSIAHSTDADSIESLAVSLEENQDGSDFNNDGDKGSLSLIQTYGIVPQDLFPVKFSATAEPIDFKPRASATEKPDDPLNPDDLLHFEVADNLRYLMETKGLDYLKTMTEQDIMENMMLSRYGVNFTAVPPKSFSFEGKSYTAQNFVTDFLKIDLNALEVRRVSSLPEYYTANNAVNTDLATFYADANANLHAGIAMPIGVSISDNRMTDGSFTAEATNNDYIAQAAEHLEKDKKIVEDYEKKNPNAVANPPVNSDDPDDILYLKAKDFVANYNPTGWNNDGGHAMMLVGPIKSTTRIGQPTDELILKNSWGVSIYGTKDPTGLTSDGLYTIQQGFIALSAQHDNVDYITPKKPGVAPFLPSAGYVASQK